MVSIAKKLKILGLNGFNIIVSVSESVGAPIRRLKSNAEAITIYNFVDTDELSMTGEEGMPIKKMEKSKTRVLFAGRLSKEKGISNLLRAWMIVVKKKPNIVLKVTGSGLYDSLLENLSGKSASKIEYLGFVSRGNLLRIYGETDIFVLPSLWPDPCPTSIMEARFFGCHIVASRAGGIIEIVKKNPPGFLFQPDDPDDLAEKLLEAIESVESETLTKSISEEFTLGVVGMKIEEIYHRLINGVENTDLSSLSN